MKKMTINVSILILLGLILGACGTASGAGGLGLTPSSVIFDVNVIEIKGATDGIEPPSTDPGSISAGYKFKAPGDYDAENLDKWQVSSYLFSPSELVVAQGDDVTLRTFVLNGDVHASWLEAPDGSTVSGTQITMNRGRQYEISFTADQTGYYTWHCDNHAPTMTAKVLVLPTQ